MKLRQFWTFQPPPDHTKSYLTAKSSLQPSIRIFRKSDFVSTVNIYDFTPRIKNSTAFFNTGFNSVCLLMSAYRAFTKLMCAILSVKLLLMEVIFGFAAFPTWRRPCETNIAKLGWMWGKDCEVDPAWLKVASDQIGVYRLECWQLLLIVSYLLGKFRTCNAMQWWDDDKNAKDQHRF